LRTGEMSATRHGACPLRSCMGPLQGKKHQNLNLFSHVSHKIKWQQATPHTPEYIRPNWSNIVRFSVIIPGYDFDPPWLQHRSLMPSIEPERVTLPFPVLVEPRHVGVEPWRGRHHIWKPIQKLIERSVDGYPWRACHCQCWARPPS
jgi:hypothetical protein